MASGAVQLLEPLALPAEEVKLLLTGDSLAKRQSLDIPTATTEIGKQIGGPIGIAIGSYIGNVIGKAIGGPIGNAVGNAIVAVVPGSRT